MKPVPMYNINTDDMNKEKICKIDLELSLIKTFL